MTIKYGFISYSFQDDTRAFGCELAAFLNGQGLDAFFYEGEEGETKTEIFPSWQSMVTGRIQALLTFEWVREPQPAA